MTDFRERYKRLGFDPETNRALRSQRRDEARRTVRDEQMSLRREMDTNNTNNDSITMDNNVSGITQDNTCSGYSQDDASYKIMDSREDTKKKAAEEHQAAVQQRWERLQKWQAERKKRKQIEKKKAKPVFKVGVVHHRVYSPVNKERVPVPPPKLCKSRDMSAKSLQVTPKRVTRATEKRLANKTLMNQHKRENIRSKKNALAQACDPMNQEKQMEIVPKNHIFKAPIGVAPMPIFGRQALETSKEKIQAEINSFHISTTTSTSAFSDSFDDSSISLKLSSDDHEMMDQSVTKEANSPITRRSSLKNLSPPVAAEACIPGDQEMADIEQISKTEKRNGSFPVLEKTKSFVDEQKSFRVLVSPVKISPTTQSKNDSFSSKQDNKTPSRKRKSINEDLKEIVIDSPQRARSSRAAAANKRRSVRIVSSESADSGIEPSLTPDEPSINKRRSIKLVASDSIVSESVEKESVPILEKPLIRRRSSKLISSESTVREKDTFMKPASIRRKSTRITTATENLNSSSIVTIADVHHSPLSNQEMNVPVESLLRKKSTRFTTQGQENVDLNVTNLMDFTFSASLKPPQLADAPKSLLDDSVMNFTSRRSSRLPPASTTAENFVEEQPLIRFSSFNIPTPSQNESSSSEPTKQHSPNEIMSLSLNMSLPKETETDKPPPAFFSPYIVQSRGKTSAMKEIKKKRFSRSGLQSDDIPTKDNIMQKLNISVEEEERTAQYYKHILDKEIERLTELCERWNVIKESGETPDEIRYIIQAACGQTQLLINKKFERFRGLVLDCETGRGEMLVTCKDLQGFWDMMYMEINDCENRFNKLDEMKANNWVEKEDEAAKELVKKKKKAPAKKPATKKPVAGKTSSLRAMIAAARKKKVETVGTVDDSETAATESADKSVEGTNNIEKIRSRHSSTPKSASKWDNLLKKVQLSQTRKSTTSPLVVMKLSQMVKTPEVQLDDSIVYINSGRTPAKSILKKDEIMGSVSKSTNKVFFKEQSKEVKEFENKSSFLDDNMSLDNEEETKEPIERRLNFEDESFIENSEENKEPPGTNFNDSQFLLSGSVDSSKNPKVVTLMMSPMISMSPLSLQDKKVGNSAMKKKSTKPKKQISFEEDTKGSESKNLRTKKFSAPLTPIPKLRNKEDVVEDISMELDDVMCDDNDDTPQEQLVKEFYLNEQGVICERFVSVENEIRGTSKLKRRNLEATQIDKKESESTKTPVTPNLRRRKSNLIEIQITTPQSTTHEFSTESISSTPRNKKQRLKKSFADTTLTQDNVDVISEELSKTPKTSKATSELKENSTQSPTRKIKRIRSLKVVNNEEDDVMKTGSHELRRTKSFNIKKVYAEDSPKAALRRKSIKKLQENIEPNQQETDQITKETFLRTPSSKRKSSKKQLEIVENNEKLISNAVSDTMTPNTRRKSLRIARASTKNEN